MATKEHSLRIRPGMDVYDTDQDHYIGSVVKVWRQPHPPSGPAAREATAQQTGSAPQTLAGTSELGPFPTIAAGNTGPVRQSAVHDYATGGSSPPADVICFAVRPGRINLGILTPPLYIPTSAVRSVSMERVILDVPGNEIPPVWRQPPPF